MSGASAIAPVAPLLAAVLLASLLGSLHCAGMCGGFMAMAVAGAARPPAKPNGAFVHAAYHLGRLITYATLGALAGGFGAALDHTGRLAGLQRGAASFAGAAMVVFGFISVLRVLGVRLARAPAPEFLRRLLVKGHAAAFELPAIARAAAVGLLTTLLPCGWLYAFAVAAAGTGSCLWGACAMAVFWAGTLPVMMTLGAGIQGLTGALGRRLPLVTAVAVIAVGMFTVAGRFAPRCCDLPSAAMVLHVQESGGRATECGP